MTDQEAAAVLWIVVSLLAFYAGAVWAVLLR